MVPLNSPFALGSSLFARGSDEAISVEKGIAKSDERRRGR
jgi:hypothetical protein